MSGILLVIAVEQYERFAFQLTGERARRRPPPVGAARDRTLARLSVSGPALVGLRRSLPQKALTRLHALVQTAADL